MHQAFAAALDRRWLRSAIYKAARAPKAASVERPRWPMIILRTPKGWTGPQGRRTAAGRGYVALAPGADCGIHDNAEHVQQLEEWMKKLPPAGALRWRRPFCAGVRRAGAQGPRRMGANPHANGGELLVPLAMPDFREYAVDIQARCG